MSHGLVHRYGTFAKRFSPETQCSEPVLIFDQTGIAEALIEAATRRSRNERFFARPLFASEAALKVQLVLPSILQTYADADQRHVALEQAAAGLLHVNGAPLSNLPVYDAVQRRLAQAVVRLSDGMVASSDREGERIASLLGQTAAPERLDWIDPFVPAVGTHCRNSRDAVVIWAPTATAEETALFTIALQDLRVPVLLVAAGGASASNAAVVPPERAADALARARVIVDTNMYGCDSTRQLSEWSAAIVSDVETGAPSRAGGTHTYRRDTLASIWDATVAALGAQPSSPRPVLGSGIQVTTSSSPIAQPLVSILLPTFNRPRIIRDALDSIVSQTYRNIDPIVVVDGGPSIAHLQANYPNIQFLHMPTNNGKLSMNTAFSLAKGKYVAFLNDDDVFFPNHIETLVSALEESNASVAHADVLTAYLRGSDLSGWTVYGFENNMNRASDPATFHMANNIGMTSCMIRKDAIGNGVLFDDNVPYYFDWSLWLRLIRQVDFVHVEKLTSCYTVRNHGAEQQSVMWADQTLAAYVAVYEHFPTERNLIVQRRNERLTSIKRGEVTLNTAPAANIADRAWPLWLGSDDGV